MKMRRIEKWRVEELSLLLDFLSAILRKGKNPEWANVFCHFEKETRLIMSAQVFDPDLVLRLVRNINNCLDAGSTFSTLVLEDQETLATNALNLEFGQARVRLWNALQEIEERMVEFVN